MINAAIATQQPVVNLPDTRIMVTKTIKVPPGTKNFTLRGGPNTILQRATTNDIILLQIGDENDMGFSNLFLSQNYEANAALPIADGADTIATVDGSNLPTGWYALVGNHPTNDTVVHTDGVTTMWYKRELIRITNSTNGVSTLGGAVGREFENPVLYRMEADGGGLKKVCENITVENIVMDGRLGERRSGRDVVNKSTRANRVFVLGAGVNCTLRNLTIKGFRNFGAGIRLSRGVTIDNVDVTDGQITVLGYGFEVMGSRFISFTNCRFSNLRWGVLWGAGCTDNSVTDCVVADTPNSGFDCSHGMDERRIVYTRCIANVYSIGNPAYLRGAQNVSLIDCTARQQMNVYANVDNVQIIGKHPNEAMTSPLISLVSDLSTAGNPVGNFTPKRVIMRRGVSNKFDGASNPMQLHTLTNAIRGIQTLEVTDWTFQNTFTGPSNAYRIGGNQIPSSAVFTACRFINNAPYDFPVYFNGGDWNLRFVGCTFTKAAYTTPEYERALRLAASTTGTVTFEGWNLLNGQRIENLNQIWNDSNMNIVFLP